MKKHTVIAFVSALAIAAGTVAASGAAPAADSEDAGNGSISYEAAIEELYSRSTSISDQ